MVLNESTPVVLGVIPGGGVRKLSITNTGSAALTGITIEGQATPASPWVPIANQSVNFRSPTTLLGVALPVGSSDITKLAGGTSGDVYVDAGKFYNIRVSATGFTGADAGVSYAAPDASSAASASGSSGSQSADVVIYGATFSGIMAAVSATRNGASVLVFEPRDDVGGMVTTGIMYTDSAWPTNKIRSTITGLVNEMYRNLAGVYGYDQQTYYQAQNYSAESKVAQQYLDALMAKWGIRVQQNAKLTSVSKTGTVINSVTFDTAGTVKGKVFIDATYTGDLMDKAGCSWTIGREAASAYSEASVNAGISVQAGDQPTVAIDPYITAGVSASGVLPFVNNIVVPANGSADGNVMAMGYRLCITNNAANKITFPAPSNYDPAKYELLRRHVLANGQGWTDINNIFLLQPVLPSNEYPSAKWDINNKGFFSLDYVHPECTEYVTATWARRQQIEDNIKEYTLGLLYFFMNDSSVPSGVRNSLASYGLCADEYQSNGYWPRRPYCREARRMIGDTVVKGTDLTALNGTTTPVAQAYYLLDSHPCQYAINGSGKVVREGGMSGTVVAAAGAKIPRSILQPKVSECTNLLVTWCGSMTHAAFATVRMEPIAGAMGEGAGVIAAMACRKGMSVQTVPGVEINRALNMYGWMDPGAIVISTDGKYLNGSCTNVGTWTPSPTTLFDTASILSCSATSGTNAVTFTPATAVIANGWYDVYVKWADSISIARGSPTVAVTANGVTSSFVVNQNTTGDGGDWYHLGKFYFTRGNGANNKVVLTHDNTSNPSNVAGVKFVPERP